LIFLAGSIVAITIWECIRAKAISWPAVANVLPIFVPLVLVRGGGQSDLDWDFRGKLVGALTLFRGYNQIVDMGFIAAVGIFLLLLFIWSTKTTAVGSFLFAGLGCVLMFVVGPSMLFGGRPADSRFLPVAAALITLSLQFRYRRSKAALLLGFFLCLVAFRIGMIGYYWRKIDAGITRQIELLARLPEEAKVYPIVKIADGPDEKKREVPSFHVICYAVLDRRIYTPTMIAFAGHTPLHYRTSDVRIMDHVNPEPFPPAAKVNWDAIFANHDHIWALRLPTDYLPILERHCTLVAEDGAAAIWRVRKLASER
jgi:hypothetical protein